MLFNEMKIILPKDGPKKAYYEAYVGYMLGIFMDNNISIMTRGHAVFNLFHVKINDKQVIMDFSDFNNINSKYYGKYPYFKFHWSKKYSSGFPMSHPFTPISFYDWREFRDMKKNISYSCNSDMVLCMQRPRGAAINRRNFVHKMLKKRYGDNFGCNFVKEQREFWRTINNCLVHVCVPGARNDMLDRGQIQLMAFGCCTISPLITDRIAWDQELIPNVHYIQCKSDYSDLIDKIEWCKSHRDNCVKIGNNAKKLFYETSTPEMLLKWLLKVINNG